eukprot:2238717-Alexandrium_andersonii.AAC.1
MSKYNRVLVSPIRFDVLRSSISTRCSCRRIPAWIYHAVPHVSASMCALRICRCRILKIGLPQGVLAVT